MVEPAAGSRWPLGDSATIRWDGAGPVNIDYSPDDGVTWSPLALAAGGTHARILAPAVATPRARVRVQRVTPFAQAESDTTFTVGSGRTLPLRVVPGSAATGGGVPHLLFTPDAPVPAGATATWRVYDVRGQCVHTGTTASLRAGVTESLVWDGRDTTGRAVARGTYIVRVSWDGHAATARLLVLSPAAESPIR